MASLGLDGAKPAKILRRAVSGVNLLEYEWIALPESPHATLDGKPLPRRPPPTTVWSAVPCLIWVVSSNGLIVLNKHLMSVDGFRYPMALSSLGMVASWVLSVAACRLGIVRAKNVVSKAFILTHFLPVGLCMAFMFYCGNRAYLFLSVSFVQMLKTATPVVTMVVMVLFKLERPTLRLTGALLLLVSGTALASFGELAFSWLGVTIMLLSEVADALRLVTTQLLLSSSPWHPIEALMYLAPACAACLLVGVLLLEWQEMQAQGALAKLARRPALYGLAAVLGFVCNAAQVASIKRVSSLTLKVVGVTANSLLVVCSGALFGDRLTTLQLVGYAVSFAGFVAYNVIKTQQAQHAKRSSSPDVGEREPLLHEPRVVKLSHGRHAAGCAGTERPACHQPGRSSSPASTRRLVHNSGIETV